MPVLIDIPLVSYEDGSVILALNPATNISGWSIQFSLSKRFGSTTPFYVASCASGFNGVSGITVLDGPNGKLSNPLPSSMCSGIAASGFVPVGNFALQYRRTDVGANTALAQGYLMLYP